MVKGCFVGSGSEGLQQTEVCAQIISLTGKPANQVKICYVGTATYDIELYKINQTRKLQDEGCKIMQIICGIDSKEDMQFKISASDVVLVSGGNTLYAVDYWNKVGLTELIRSAAANGCILAGGSAGAICWFDAGHSDSADPDTFKVPMLKEAEAAAAAALGKINKDESTTLVAGQEKKMWEYIRVPCLGLLPGLVCPHADKIQSNGILRVTDFNDMLLRHRGERGICIDHFAALIIEDERYSVLSLPGKPGSVLPSGEFSDSRSGVPGIWIKDVTDDGKVETSLAPAQGLLADLLKVASNIQEDPKCDSCRRANPAC